MTASQRTARFWVVVVVIVVAIIWASGIADRMLSSSGLNARTCVVTGLGQKLCGEDAKAWCTATDPLRPVGDPVGDSTRTLCAKVRSGQ